MTSVWVHRETGPSPVCPPSTQEEHTHPTPCNTHPFTCRLALALWWTHWNEEPVQLFLFVAPKFFIKHPQVQAEAAQEWRERARIPADLWLVCTWRMSDSISLNLFVTFCSVIRCVLIYTCLWMIIKQYGGKAVQMLCVLVSLP